MLEYLKRKLRSLVEGNSGTPVGPTIVQQRCEGATLPICDANAADELDPSSAGDPQPTHPVGCNVPSWPRLDYAPGSPGLSALWEMTLRNQYRSMADRGIQLPRIDEVGYAIYSESDEDGILNYIFALIGVTQKKLVDIGAAAIDGSNTANLIINHGWTGLLIEASSENVELANSFYSTWRTTKSFPPKIVNQWVHAENVNQVLSDNGFTGEIDLLCIDIDGIDYWVWKAIDCIRPRVVVVEYQCIWGPEASVTVPYDPDFVGGRVGQYRIYSGASLAAFVKLGREKQYRLVGCQRYGYNAFFVRNDLSRDVLPEVSPAECFRHPFTHWARETFLPQVVDLKWVHV